MCEHENVKDFIAKKMIFQNKEKQLCKNNFEGSLKKANFRKLNETDDHVVLTDSHNNQLIVNKESKSIIIGGIADLTFEEIKMLFELYKMKGWL